MWLLFPFTGTRIRAAPRIYLVGEEPDLRGGGKEHTGRLADAPCLTERTSVGSVGQQSVFTEIGIEKS